MNKSSIYSQKFHSSNFVLGQIGRWPKFHPLRGISWEYKVWTPATAYYNVLASKAMLKGTIP
jgi:hypothetical protein